MNLIFDFLAHDFIGGAFLQRLGDVVLLIIGALLGWLISDISAMRERKKRHLDEFRSAIGEQIDRILIEDNKGDYDFALHHQYAYSMLSRFKIYMRNHKEKQWKKLEPAWEDFRKLRAGVTTEGIPYSEDAKFLTKERLIDGLVALQRSVESI